jgi:hypothetical protein
MGTGLFPRVSRMGRNVKHPANLEKVPLWSVLWWTISCDCVSASLSFLKQRMAFTWEQRCWVAGTWSNRRKSMCLICLSPIKYAGCLCRLFWIWFWQANSVCIWRSIFRVMEFVLKTRNAFSFTGYALFPVEVNVRDFMSPAKVCNNSNRLSNRSVK